MKIFSLAIIAFFSFINICKANDDSKEISEIKSVVNRWNELHNGSNIEEFIKIYAPTVLFYGKYTNKQECYQTKHKYLNNNFHQTIASTIDIKFYTSGTVKCDFTKRVMYRQKTTNYPAYLLLEKQNGQYLITGESDLNADKEKSITLNLGDEKSNSPYIFSGSLFLSIAGFSVFYIKRRNKKKKEIKITSANQENIIAPDIKKESTENLVNQDETKQHSEDQFQDESAQKGYLFEKYVLSKFPEEYYKTVEWRGDKCLDGRYPESNKYPDIELRLKTKSAEIDFAVECKWRKDFFEGAIKWAEEYQIKNYKDFEYSRRKKVFVIIGIGGDPNNPESVYIIPLKEIKYNKTHFFQGELKKYYRYKRSYFFLTPLSMILE